MKTAIITDTHFGCRKNSRIFHDYFEEFYANTFFPKLDELGIKTVVHMGDCFDSRKGVDFSALAWAKRVFFDPLRDRGIALHLIVGNHDAYYKNTNEINSIDLLLSEYNNVHTYNQSTEIKLDNLDVLLIPWITSENTEKTVKLLKDTSCKVAMGHLELTGFKVNKHVIMDSGFDSQGFEKFSKVFSGHFHTRSDNGVIFYLGNAYEMYWTDVGDDRGFHIFDTETLEHEHVVNPYSMFKVINYEDTPYQTFDVREYEGKIVKIIVRKKSDIHQFEKFIDKLYSVNVAELKVVENFDFNGWYQEEDDEAVESEDTLSILDTYINGFETDLDKTRIQNMMKSVYQEACELV